MIFQTRLGAHTLFAIEDGWVYRDPVDWMKDSQLEDWDIEYFVNGQVRISMGCFLLAGPAGLLMIDSGNGPPPDSPPEGTGSGHMPEALQALHVDPADIEIVIHTHLHPDHTGGNVKPDGSFFFPNARFYVHERELEYWTSGEGAGTAAHDRVKPLVEAGVIDTLDGDKELLPGITALETFGHTPGHMAVYVMSEGTRSLIAGDITHHPIQANHTDWNVDPDVDKPAAEATRKRLFEELADSETLLAAGHYPRPGLGYVESDDAVRVFVHATTTSID